MTSIHQLQCNLALAAKDVAAHLHSEPPAYQMKCLQDALAAIDQAVVLLGNAQEAASGTV